MLLATSPSVALPGLPSVGLEPGEGELYAGLLATELRERGVRVVSQEDISAVLGMERQKQLLGCDTSCTSELAAALGVDAVVVGRIGLLGRGYTVSVRLVSAKDGEVLADTTENAPLAAAMPATLEHAAWSLTRQLAQHAPFAALDAGPEPAPWREPRASLRTWALVPAAVGVASLAAGVGLRFKAVATLGALEQATSVTEARALRDAGNVEQTAGLTLLAVGGAASLTALAMALLAPAEPTVTATLVPTPGGAVLAVGGTWP